MDIVRRKLILVTIGTSRVKQSHSFTLITTRRNWELVNAFKGLPSELKWQINAFKVERFVQFSDL